MAKRKIAEKKESKVKQKQENKISVGPRFRLEPRFISSRSKKHKVSQDHEDKKDSICIEENDLGAITSQKKIQNEENSFALGISEERERNETLDACISPAAAEENMSYRTGSPKIQSPSKNYEIEENSSPKKLTPKNNKRGRRIIIKGFDWNDRERMDLAIGLQAHGFFETKKLADCVKTKNENDIKQYLRLRRREAVKSTASESTAKMHNKRILNGQGNKWNTLRSEFVASWPNIRKWRKLAYEQMLPYTRSKDYSKIVISSLCKKFHEEEKEPADPQVINVKLIYKYMMDSLAGEIPAQLPPKESALVLDLLREVRSMPIAYDFEEERKFLHDFKTATKFKPFQVKDEFKKRYKKEPEDMFAPNTVAVPEEVFLDLSRHKRLTQSFSPLVTPVWMLQKEQELLEKHAKESNVYVD